jgi:hypothetical protein
MGIDRCDAAITPTLRLIHVNIQHVKADTAYERGQRSTSVSIEYRRALFNRYPATLERLQDGLSCASQSFANLRGRHPILHVEASCQNFKAVHFDLASRADGHGYFSRYSRAERIRGVFAAFSSSGLRPTTARYWYSWAIASKRLS